MTSSRQLEQSIQLSPGTSEMVANLEMTLKTVQKNKDQTKQFNLWVQQLTDSSINGWV